MLTKTMKALVVVDMQVGSFAEGLPRFDATNVISRINALGSLIRRDGIVIWIQHTSERDGFARGSIAWDILPELQRAPGDVTVEKTACDSFLGTSLGEDLKTRGVTDLIVTGCATDFCVDTTVRAAASLGFAVTVASDAHTTRDRPHLDARSVITHHNWMWGNLLLPNGKVRVVSTESLLDELKSR